MKTRLFFFLLFSTSLFYSCLNGRENALEKDNTIIYFDHDKDEGYAKKVLDFWIFNKFTGKRKQYLKLSPDKNNNTYLLKVIVRDDFKSKKIPFDDIKYFNDIQAQLNREIFVDKPCQIAICDSYFKIITIPNKISP